MFNTDQGRDINAKKEARIAKPLPRPGILENLSLSRLGILFSRQEENGFEKHDLGSLNGTLTRVVAIWELEFDLDFFVKNIFEIVSSKFKGVDFIKKRGNSSLMKYW